MITGKREGRLQRPSSGVGLEYLVEVLINAMLGIAGDRMDSALAFDDGVLAGRARHPRLLYPFAGIGRLWRNAGHVALFLRRFWNVGDRLVVQSKKKWKLLF